MYLPVPMFWALYDQQLLIANTRHLRNINKAGGDGHHDLTCSIYFYVTTGSVWTIQAVQMNCRLWGNFLLLPDQMQTMNAVLILLFIPLFQIVIYPLISRFVDFTPLRRMVVGGVLAALSFVIAGFVQLQINTSLAELPGQQQSFVSVTNTLQNCSVTVAAMEYPDIAPKTVPANYSLVNDRTRGLKQMFRLNAGQTNFTLSYTGDGCAAYSSLPSTAAYDLEPKKIQALIIGHHGTYLTTVQTNKPTNGNGEFAIIRQDY
ncbi:unnamed protein product [Gongylonema pulchrum]|uniref:Integral membrane protein n=1 Tax=Gongylonema pulchrum TaxID=637853 RepID=A0A183CY29_9BILA|nr:unnamed protein product [Gongylonema pulchrum]